MNPVTEDLKTFQAIGNNLKRNITPETNANQSTDYHTFKNGAVFDINIPDFMPDQVQKK